VTALSARTLSRLTTFILSPFLRSNRSFLAFFPATVPPFLIFHHSPPDQRDRARLDIGGATCFASGIGWVTFFCLLFFGRLAGPFSGSFSENGAACVPPQARLTLPPVNRRNLFFPERTFFYALSCVPGLARRHVELLFFFWRCIPPQEPRSFSC